MAAPSEPQKGRCRGETKPLDGCCYFLVSRLNKRGIAAMPASHIFLEVPQPFVSKWTKRMQVRPSHPRDFLKDPFSIKSIFKFSFFHFSLRLLWWRKYSEKSAVLRWNNRFESSKRLSRVHTDWLSSLEWIVFTTMVQRFQQERTVYVLKIFEQLVYFGAWFKHF